MVIIQEWLVIKGGLWWCTNEHMRLCYSVRYLTLTRSSVKSSDATVTVWNIDLTLGPSAALLQKSPNQDTSLGKGDVWRLWMIQNQS